MSYLLDLDQLKTFVAIADTGSFTRAAERVNKTQSAVSMQMRRLEERVAKPIFVRDGRQSRLTGEGHLLLDYARRMLALNNETFAAFSEEALSGTVRLGLPDDYAPRLLPCILAAFANSHPTIEVNVTCINSNEVSRRIQDGDLDLGIVTHGDTQIGSRIIRREPLLWVTSAHHTAHCSDPVPLAVAPRNCCWRAKAIAALEAQGRDHRIAYSSASAYALSGAVLAGLAVAVLPESAVMPEMRILRERDGYPELPPCDIAILRATLATDRVHDALAEHIIATLDNLTFEAAAAE
ncbi:LysR substrate-binding domain-containing protein [Coralliovum pocilloporae]|uniref:LysR substrate-binding domain-containing protein n=1 Tax=Coralliovum pocilloporae TaxID=3066369 RepID=UPI003306D5F9